LTADADAAIVPMDGNKSIPIGTLKSIMGVRGSEPMEVDDIGRYFCRLAYSL
jgi:hypothetical protein